MNIGSLCDKDKFFGSESSSACLNIPPLSPVVQNVIHGHKICGERNGTPYSNLRRPSKYHYKPYNKWTCPKGFMPCNGKPVTHLSNTFCMEENQLERCPITDIRTEEPNAEDVQDY